MKVCPFNDERKCVVPQRERSDTRCVACQLAELAKTLREQHGMDVVWVYPENMPSIADLADADKKIHISRTCEFEKECEKVWANSRVVCEVPLDIENCPGHKFGIRLHNELIQRIMGRLLHIQQCYDMGETKDVWWKELKALKMEEPK